LIAFFCVAKIGNMDYIPPTPTLYCSWLYSCTLVTVSLATSTRSCDYNN